MCGWYAPENAYKKQKRLLHHCPSGMLLYLVTQDQFSLLLAFKLLSKKAQLLGYETQVCVAMAMLP